MRLIDADKLYPDCMTKNGTLAISQSQIANAPTIKPERTQGRWVWRSTSQWCSECSALKPRKYPYLNYCPNCGAKMVKGAEA